MKYCSQCGSVMNDTDICCSQCGTRTTPEQIPISNQSQPLYASRAVEAVRKCGSSPLFLAAVIAFSAMIVFTILNSLSGVNSLQNHVYDLFRYFDLSEFYELYPGYDLSPSFSQNSFNYFTQAKQLIIFSSILGMLPQLTYAAGLWMIFAACLTKNHSRISTAGFTTIKVITIISLVLSCIAIIIVEFVLFFITIALLDFGKSAIVFLAVFLMLMIAAVLVLLVLYYAKILTTLNTITKTIRTGIPSSKVSLYVAVMNFILVFFSIFGLFTNFRSFLASGARIIFYILISIALIKYKSIMENLNTPGRY